MNDILNTHRNEIAKALRNFKFERTQEGIYVPDMKKHIRGMFMCRVNGGDASIDPNMVVNQGLDTILNLAFGSLAKITNFYIAPFTGAVDVVEGLTAANFTSEQTEFTNYDESNRVAWTHPTSTSTQTMHNTASPARFTIATGGGTIEGAGLLTAQAKSNTGGLLIAAARFAAPRVLLATDKLDIEYILTASDAG